MTKLYVANPSRQDMLFRYREPESNILRHIDIPKGTQNMVCEGDASLIDSVLQQNALYGLVDVSHAVRRGRAFVGMCYSRDRPIQIEDYQILGAKNEEVLSKRGDDIRAAAAVAASQHLTETASAFGAQAGSTDLAILEDDTPAQRGEIKKTVRVSEDADTGKRR